MSWYTHFRIALRKNNLRVDLRVYSGEELEQPNPNEIQNKLKSILSSAIIKGLDVIGVVSKYGIEIGNMAKQVAEQTGIDIKVIPGQDYQSADGYKGILYNLQQNIQPNLMMQQAIQQCKQQGGRVLLYDLSRSHAKEVNKWKGQVFAPDLIEIYNAHSKTFKDVEIDYPRVISSAARSGSDLESIPVYTELQRGFLEKVGLLKPEEGQNYIPGYLQKVTQNG